MNKDKREVWQRGPIARIPTLLQAVAHALLQAREEVNEMLVDFPDALLWEKPAGVASVAFHLQHLAGVLDRLFTYVRGDILSDVQLQSLSAEGQPAAMKGKALVELFNCQVDKALAQLSTTNEQTLTEAIGVGRAQIPSTVIGILVHAAEHTMRHVGQLHVTVRVLNGPVNKFIAACS